MMVSHTRLIVFFATPVPLCWSEKLGDGFQHFGKLWPQSYKKISLTKMQEVISLSLPLMYKHEVSAFWIAETRLENQYSSLHDPDMTNCSISLLLICVNLVFLMLCCDTLSVKQALRLRIARPLCDDHSFAFSPPGESKPLSLRLSSMVAFSNCNLSVQTPVTSRPSYLLSGNRSNPVQSSIRRIVLLLSYCHMVWQMSIHIDADTTLQRN